MAVFFILEINAKQYIVDYLRGMPLSARNSIYIL